MVRIVVIAGVVSERDVLAKAGVRSVALSGTRPDGCEKAVAGLLAGKPDALLSFGTAGGLAPGIRPGALFVAKDIVTATGEHFATDQSWSDHMASRLGVTPSDIFGSDKVLSAADKKAVFTEAGCAAADMESHIAARLAANAGVPFAVLRAVSDADDMDLPSWLAGCVKEDGSTSIGGVAAGILAHPQDIGKLIAVGRGHARAIDALGGALGILGPDFGFGTR